MTPRQLRNTQRLVHLMAAPLVIAYIYATPTATAPLTLIVRVLATPLVVLSGLMMWKLIWLRRALTRGR